MLVVTGRTGRTGGMPTGGGDGDAVPCGLKGPLLLLPTLPNLADPPPPFWDEKRMLFGILPLKPGLDVGSK
jgi:hypothetical protein